MMQKHNRHMSFSLYISALAVSDTVSILCGEYTFMEHAFSIAGYILL